MIGYDILWTAGAKTPCGRSARPELYNMLCHIIICYVLLQHIISDICSIGLYYVLRIAPGYMYTYDLLYYVMLYVIL